MNGITYEGKKISGLRSCYHPIHGPLAAVWVGEDHTAPVCMTGLG